MRKRIPGPRFPLLTVVLALGRGTGCSAAAEPAPCGPNGATTVQCPVDDCAAECTSESEALQCCLATHAFGLADDNLLAAEAWCAESGCDAKEFIGEHAAICIAQVHKAERSATLIAGSRERRRAWQRST